METTGASMRQRLRAAPDINYNCMYNIFLSIKMGVCIG